MVKLQDDKGSVERLQVKESLGEFISIITGAKMQSP